MKIFALLFALMCMIQTATFSQDNHISFIKNANQWEPQIAYKSFIPGGALFLTNSGLRYSFYSTKDLDAIHEMKHEFKNIKNEPVHFHAFDVSFIGANSSPSLQANKKLSEYHNYYLGKDASKWATNVPLFQNIIYNNLYPGIDMSIYSEGKSIKYDFLVAPNSNPSVIQLGFNGVKPVLKSNGDLYIKTSVNEISELAPYSYQIIDGIKHEVPCKFVIKGNILSYEFMKGYNTSLPLVIDPVLIFSTYSGSNATTYGFSATYDLSGSLYAGGECFGVGWPSSVGAFQLTYGGSVDAGINKYTPTGNALMYSTYFGGTGSDLPNNLVVNANDELVVFGSTSSSNMPVTTGCYDNSLNGGTDMFVAHFNVGGTALIGSTYIGGSAQDGQNSFSLSPNYGDGNRGEVFIDAAQNILCAGSTSSSNFPTTPGCYQSTFGGAQDGCIFKLDPTCSTLLISTFVGGSDDDACFAINTNSAGNIISVGGTQSNNFPTTAGTLHPTLQGGTDGFVVMLNSACSNLIASTYLGTNVFDHAFKMQVDQADNVYVCGQTDGPYPVTPGLYNNPGAGIFFDKLNPTLTASLASTIVGQVAGNLVPTAFLYDECGNVYFSGFQAQAGLPLTANAHQTTPGGFWVCVLEMNMTNLLYATYMGAGGDHVDGGTSRFDPQGIIYQSVCTASSNQYNSVGSWSPSNQASSWDVASFKFDFEASGVNAGSDIAITSNDSVCTPATIQFVNNSTGATSYIWDFGDGSPFSTAFAPSHVYTTAGTYTVTLIANNPLSCVTTDTSSLVVYIFTIDKPILDIKDTIICEQNVTANLNAPVTNQNSNMTFRWEPASAIIGSSTSQSITVDPSIANSFTVTVTDSVMAGCKEFAQGVININYGDTSLFKVEPMDTTICMYDIISLTASGGNYYAWKPTYQISDTTTSVVQVWAASPVVYSVLIKDIHGCSATRYVNIKTYSSHVDAGDDEIIRYGESIQLNATGAFSYQWQNDPTLSAFNIPDPVANPEVTTTYYVEGFTAEGCKAKDTVVVNVTNAIVPNAFSPNGDGLNDLFKFKIYDSKVAMKSMRVFNRWGNEMFYSKNANIGWDGKYKGKECDNAVYYYLIEYSIGDRTYVDKGDITLIR